MSNAVLVRLRPTGPWRIGPDSGDRDRVDRVYHSDALYAAVCGAMFRLGEGDAWLDATARAHERSPGQGHAPAVRLSSCFPFHASTRFVVPPQNVWPPPPSSKVRWKSARFVPMSVVETLLAGKPLSEDAFAIDEASECLVPSSAQVSPFRTAVRSRAAVDRTGESVAPHSSACLEFSPGAGLWFVGVFADDAARERWRGPLEGALRLLADSGFGGERSLGWGRSETPEIADGSLASLVFKSRERNPEAGIGATNATEAPAYWMLSLFHPAEGEAVDWQHGQYSLTTRGGRVESSAGWGQPKKLTRMVAEGSVLVAASEPRGAAPNVAPEQFAHPVYRAGFALCVPIPWMPAASANGWRQEP
jgi:CRISPR type III-A-associated RAMP protein Csm4